MFRWHLAGEVAVFSPMSTQPKRDLAGFENVADGALFRANGEI